MISLNTLLLSLATNIVVYLLFYKYATLFLIAFFAALFVPLPSNTSLLTAAAFASRGYLNIYLVMSVALIANILGDCAGFWFSDKYGETFLTKIGLGKFMGSKAYKEAEAFIHRNSRLTIFVTRFFGGVGPAVNILSGLSTEIPFKKFFLYDVLGETVYVLSFCMFGYFGGVVWEDNLLSVQSVGAVALLIASAYILHKTHFHRRR